MGRIRRNRFFSRRLARRFSRADAGVSTIEFAIAAPVFFAVAFAIIECGWQFTRIAMIENAASTLSRMIYTGQFSDGNTSQDEMEEMVCNQIKAVADCADDVTVEVSVIDTFSDIPTAGATCVDKNDTDPSSPGYDFSSGDEIVFVRICVSVDILTPALPYGLHLPENEHGRFEVISSLVFRNEPF